VGRAGSGKTHLCYKEIAENVQKEGDHPLILLVPEQFTLQSQKDLIFMQRQKGIIQAEVLSFQRMAYRIFGEMGGPSQKMIGDLGKNMILRKVIDQMKEKLQIFHKSIKQPGFMQTLSDMITEFHQYDIHPETLVDSEQKLEDRPTLKAKVNDLYLIYDEFQRYIEEQYITTEQTLDILFGKIETCTFLDDAEIWIDGFYGFTPQQYRILSQLLKKVRRINITVPLDIEDNSKIVLSETDPFYENKRTIEKLNKIAVENHIEMEETVFLSYQEGHRFEKSMCLAHLEQQYFQYPYIPYEGIPDDIRIFEASNPYSEIEHIGAKIVSLVRDQHYRYKEIAVVTGGLEQYQQIIEGIFKEYEIPYFIDVKKSIMTHPLIEFIRAAVEIVCRNWSYESMFRYLKTNLTEITQEEVDILENYALAYGIKGITKWTKSEWIYIEKDQLEDPIQKQYESMRQKQMNEIREKVTEPLIRFHKKLKDRKKHTVSEMTMAIYELLEEQNISEKLIVWVQEFEQKNHLLLAKQNTQIWNQVVELFDKMVEILGDEIVTIEQYAQIVDAGFEQCKMGLIPPGLDQVVVGDLERSRLHQIKALFIVGVNDGILPAPPQNNGLFSDMERIYMDGMGVEMGADGRRKAFEEEFLIYSGITKPQQYLHISYALGDEEGKALRPSVLINRIKKLFPDIIQEGNWKHPSVQEMISKPIPTFHYIGIALRKLLEEEEMDSVWKDVYSWYIAQGEWRDKARIAVKGLFHTNQENYMTKESVRNLYGEKIYSSVSRLEAFATCPFCYFIRYGLKAKERKLYQLQTPDLGRLFHRALDVFSNKLNHRQISWKQLDQEQSGILVDETIDEIAPKLVNEILISSARNLYLIKRLKRITKRAVWTLMEHIKRGEFEPLGYEIGFGENDKLPPIIIELTNGEKIILTGRIDRVDILDENDQAYIKIIDYKSGSKQFNLADIYYGIQLQLLLYLDAFLDQGEQILEKTLLPAGIFYFKIDDPMIHSAKEMTDEQLEKLLLKELKMSGMVLKDVEVVKKMDNQLERYSDILPVQLSKDGFAKRSSIASVENFEQLRSYVRKVAQEIGEEIVSGNVKISPFKSSSNTSCDYCLYQSICQFDTLLKDNEYRVLRKLDQEEIWEKIKEEAGEDKKQ
jgi:ATP-dependent helicase/nuclease subunit B